MAIPYIYYPEINLGFITLYTWGLIVALGFLAGIFFAAKHAKEYELDPDEVYNISFYIIIGGILGSRLAFVFGHWSNYSSNLIEIFKLWNGGMAFFGGLIGAILFAYLYIRIKKLSFWRYADLYAPSIALGHAIGRIACLVGDGGHVGRLTNLPFGVLVNGEVRHLTALYSFVNLSFLFIILLILRKKKYFTGFLFIFYMVYYGATRFIIELFKEFEPRYLYLTGSQWVSVVIFILGIYLFFEKHTIKSLSKKKA